MTTTDPNKWIKASVSGGDASNCVEMRSEAGVVEVRDTKAHGTEPSLTLVKAAFAAWLDGAKDGEFDRLLD